MATKIRYRNPSPRAGTGTRTKIKDSYAIHDVGVEILSQWNRNWSIDELLCHPKDAVEFCRLVRSKLSRPTLTDYEICKSMINGRKRSRTVPDVRHKRPRPQPATV